MISYRVIAFGLGLLTATGVLAKEPALVTTWPFPEGHAEWLRQYHSPWTSLEYHPYGKSIRGIPLKRIDTSWCKANELSPDQFPDELWKWEGYKNFNDIGISFSVSGKFMGSSKTQQALVGIYETCEQKQGLFLLIIEGKRSPRIRFQQNFPDEQFLGLRKDPKGEIDVWFCVGGCDDMTTLKWNKKEERFTWVSNGLSFD